MSLPYISPSQMQEYRQQVLLFAKGAPQLECIHSHYLPDASGVCDLTRTKDHEDIFVLANRAGHTLKVCRSGLQIIANILDIEHGDEAFEHLREQKKAHKERLAQESLKREEERQKSQRTVLIRRRRPTQILREKNS